MFMSFFFNHLSELKIRLFYIFLMFFFNSLVLFSFIEELCFFFSESFINDLNYFIFTDFLEKLHLSFYLPVYVSSFFILPVSLLHLSLFSSPGLYITEQTNLKYSIFFVFIGVYIYNCLFMFFLPYVYDFLIFFSLSNYWKLFEIHNEIKIISFLFFSLSLYVYCLIACLLPIFFILFFFIFDNHIIFLLGIRKYIYSFIILFNGLFFFNDFITQVAVCFFFCFFLSVLCFFYVLLRFC